MVCNGWLIPLRFHGKHYLQSDDEYVNPPFSVVEAQVSILVRVLLLCVIYLFDNFCKLSWRLSSNSCLNILPWKYCLFIFINLYGHKSGVYSSMCRIQRPYVGQFLGKFDLCLWLWGIKLVVGLGCRFKVDHLSGCFAMVFPLTYIFLCWYSMWY